MPNDQDRTAADMADNGPALVRENAKKMAGAEANPRAATDKLKAQGEGMAKKHGG